MDYLYEQIKHYKGDSTRPLHGIFPNKQKSSNSSEKQVKPLVIDSDFEEKLSTTIQNFALHCQNRYDARGNGEPEPYENRRTARILIHNELLGLFRAMRGERHFLRRAPRQRQLPFRRRMVEPKGIVHKELITSLFDSLGVNYSDDEAMIFREKHYFRVNLNTSEVFIHFADDEKKYAFICLQPVGAGWSNAGYTFWEIDLISKITSIVSDELPYEIKSQIENFLKNERGGPNLSLRYGDRQFSNGIVGLRDEMLQELARLRDIMHGPAQNVPRPQRQPQPREYAPSRASLQRELRALFRHMRNDA